MDQATIDTINRRLREFPAPSPLGVYRGKEVYAVSDVLEYWLDIAIEPDALPTEIRDEFIASLMKHGKTASDGQNSESLMVCGELPALHKIARQMLLCARKIVSENPQHFPGRRTQIMDAQCALDRKIKAT